MSRHVCVCFCSVLVGYQTVNIPNTYNLVALSFENLGETKSIDIQDVFDPATLTAGTTFTTADQIQIWNGASFDVYWYRANKTDGAMAARWTLGPAWVSTKAEKVVATKALEAGLGFWFVRPNTNDVRTLTFSGGVKGDANTFTLATTYTMMGSAFPMDIVLNDKESCPFNWEKEAVAGTTFTTADQIQIWNGATFDVYWYRANKTDGAMAARWTLGPAWVSTKAEKVVWTGSIPAGKAIWYVRPGADPRTMTQESPIAPKAE